MNDNQALRVPSRCLEQRSRIMIWGDGKEAPRREFAVLQLKWIALSVTLLFLLMGTAWAGGLLGPPQSVSREAGGLHTGIGYGYLEDIYKNGTQYLLRQNQVYSDLGYGARNWDFYGRIGASDIKISDAFRSTQSSTTTSKNDFKDQWGYFGTLGAKGFYPFNKSFGIGVFTQASYFFTDFSDQVAGDQNGVPFTTELKVNSFWDVNFGVGFQATFLRDIRVYAGPYLYYSQLKTSPSETVSGVDLLAENRTIHNRKIAGGFVGVDIPITRGFRLNVETEFSERFSFGTAITYSY